MARALLAAVKALDSRPPLPNCLLLLPHPPLNSCCAHQLQEGPATDPASNLPSLCRQACGLAGLGAGMAIGIVGDAGVRANAQQPKLFVGMILILIFAEALALYGLIGETRWPCCCKARLDGLRLPQWAKLDFPAWQAMAATPGMCLECWLQSQL